MPPAARRSPGVRFKLDAEASWIPALVDEVAATGAVDTIDFKGHDGFEVKDPQALAALYDHVLAAFPDAYLEDPHDLPEVAQRLGDHLLDGASGRLADPQRRRHRRDAAGRARGERQAVADRQPAPAVGGLRALRAGAAADVRRWHGELGVGRGQIGLLAALFHADAPNDVAPSAYNEDEPAGLYVPASPLAPRPVGDRLSLGGVVTRRASRWTASSPTARRARSSGPPPARSCFVSI